MASSNPPSHAQGSGHHSTDTDHGVEEDHNDEEHVAGCGIGCFQPTAWRMCATIPGFTGVFSLSALMTSTLTMYVNSQVTTMERHFGFSSSQTGIIMAANDMGFLAVVIFLSCMATKVHIPRALGCFTILFGVASIACALPYILFGAPSPSSSNGDDISNVSTVTSSEPSGRFRGQMCHGVNNASSSCDVLEDPGQSVDPGDAARAHAGTALVIIVMGMVLQGMAKAPRYTFSTVYLDDNVDHVKTGLYMGIIISLGIMGPAMAFALGGLFSRTYVTLEDTDMHYRHPKWIGAWWLGYLTFGCAACLVAIPLFCFPRRMRGGHHKTGAVTRPPPHSGNVLNRPAELVKGFFAAMTRLLTNPVYVCSVLGTSCVYFGLDGGLAFTPKYIENQFAFPAWKANMALAGVVMGIGVLGTFVGGNLTKTLKMGAMTTLKFIIGMETLSAIGFGLLIAFTCEQPDLYNRPGPLATEETSIQGCLGSCACDDGDYFPVCADDGRTFFSPCHAGCDSTANGVYVNCTCIPEGTAVAGTCDYSCVMFYPYIVTLSFAGAFTCMAFVPQLIIYIRAVEERDKPLALGFSSFLTSVTAWMLGPICFGYWIDSICIQWEQGCGASGGGACSLYDNDSFRWKLMGFQFVFWVLGLVFYVLAYIAARVTKKFDEEKKEDSPPPQNVSEIPLMMAENAGNDPDKESTAV